jgi:hypothetical protein
MDQPRVTQGAMARADLQAMALDQAVEVVPRVLREQLARKLDSAKHRSAKVEPGALEFILQKAVVEARVVGNEQSAFQARQNLACHLREGGRAGNHCTGDPGQAFNEGRDRNPWIDQGGPFAHTVRVNFDDADFGDAVGRCRCPGGFEVDEGKWRKGHKAGRWRRGAASYRAAGRTPLP